MKIDVIIPTLRPQTRFLELVERLEEQSQPVHKIIVMNTERTEFERLDSVSGFLAKHPAAVMTHLSREAFDHGATRNAGVEQSDAAFFVCMTQDALPADRFLLEKLLCALEQGKDVAAAYARQLPEEDCKVMERYTRQFNYPAKGCVKGKQDLQRLGIKTFFCSNVCAMYRRDIFDSLGGFVPKTIFNEDMIYAAHAVQAGYRIAYAADARVIHSHNYTAMQQFRRNFDLGVSHALYPEVFAAVPPEGEGKRLVKKTAAYLCKHRPQELCRLVGHSAAKLAGYRLGKHYQSLPAGMVRWCSMQKSYWQ